MKQWAWRLITVLIAAAILWGCANIVAPEGGEKDEIPPRIVTEKSTPNFQVRFEKKPIELTFNEWVELKDVFGQVVVSPPLEYNFELTLKRRTVIFEFDDREELRPEATYTINFGEAVQDLTERNPAENLRFVFSTGDFIDSLSVRGIIVDAFTNDPVEGALFMLYDNLADSVVRTERPFYFARTKEDGTFLIENVKSGLFKGFALQDQNLNYLFDQALEPIGFPDSLIEISDTLQPSLAVRLFTEEQPLRLMDADVESYGRIRLAFSKPPDDELQISWQDVGQRVIIENAPDTTKLWYAQDDDKGWKFFLQKDTILRDTTFVRGVSDRQEFLANARLSPSAKGSTGNNVNPSGPIYFGVNHPIDIVDTSLLSLLEDTLRKPIKPAIELDTNGQRRLRFSYPWKEGKPYTLELMPGALTDIHGLANDTIIQNYQIELRKAFGNLLIIVDSLSADSTYLIELMDGKSETPVDTFQIRNTTRFERELRAIEPASYMLRLIIDWNGNGSWDPGNYDRMLQPEPIYRRQLEQLRANWDLEATVTLKELQQLGKIQPPVAPRSFGVMTDTSGNVMPIDTLGVDTIRKDGQRLPPSGRGGN